MPEEVHGGRWTWGLVDQINEASDLKEALQVFVGGLCEKYNSRAASIWQWKEEQWVQVAAQGESLGQPFISSLLASIAAEINKPENGIIRILKPETREFFILPLRQKRTHALLAACVSEFDRELSSQLQEDMSLWLLRFSWLLALHIEQEERERTFWWQQTAVSLLLNGTNILNRVSTETELFTEAGEMAMGILHVDKGVFIVNDDLKSGKVWLNGFGRLKDLHTSVERSELAAERNTFCDAEGVSVDKLRSLCSIFTDSCDKYLEKGWKQEFILSKFPVKNNGETVGELWVLHDPHEFDELEREMMNSFVFQISLALETLRHRAALERLATHDPLTGLLNRKGLEERLETECARAGRLGEALLFIVMDLDHFKKVNDTYGHPQGDQLLIKLGRVLAASVRSYDLVARLGGDEFVIVYSGWEDTPENYARVAEWLKQVLAQLPDLGIKLGMSAGVARFPHLNDFRSLYQKADEYLYQAKQQGRNRICGLVDGKSIQLDNDSVKTIQQIDL
ncbi:hypothetical protein JCM15765_21140 [Paradesulfitobacterium aromaticivorans]